MKPLHIILVLPIFVALSSLIFGQTKESFVTIKTHGGKCVVSGVVSDNKTKESVIQIVGSKCAGTVDANSLVVDYLVKLFKYNWEKNFKNSIAALKPNSDGLLLFKLPERNVNGEYPSLPQEILESKIVFLDGTERKLADLSNGFLLVYLMEDWAKPVRTQLPVLIRLHREYADFGFHIVGISTDTERASRRSLAKLAKETNIPFSVGRAEASLSLAFARISRQEAVPQAFLIKSNRLRAVFVGGGPHVERMLNESVKSIVDREIRK